LSQASFKYILKGCFVPKNLQSKQGRQNDAGKKTTSRQANKIGEAPFSGPSGRSWCGLCPHGWTLHHGDWGRGNSIQAACWGRPWHTLSSEPTSSGGSQVGMGQSHV